MKTKLPIRLAALFIILGAILASQAGFGLSVAPKTSTSRFLKSFIPQDTGACFNHVGGILKLHSQHAHTMIHARILQIEELTHMRESALQVASFATFLFAFCMALLWTLIFWKYILRPRYSKSLAVKFSIALVTINFLTAFFWVRHSADHQTMTIVNFKKGLDSVKVEVLHKKGKTSEKELGQFIIDVHTSYYEVPTAYHLTDKKLPPKKRWWTLGWDDVNAIDFELAAAQVLKKRFELEAAGMKNALPMLKELCSSS